MKLTPAQENALAWAYQELYGEFMRVKRMRSEPYMAPRKAILLHMRQRMLELQTVFTDLGIKAEFKEIPGVDV